MAKSAGVRTQLPVYGRITTTTLLKGDTPLPFLTSNSMYALLRWSSGAPAHPSPSSDSSCQIAPLRSDQKLVKMDLLLTVSKCAVMVLPTFHCRLACSLLINLDELLLLLLDTECVKTLIVAAARAICVLTMAIEPRG